MFDDQPIAGSKPPSNLPAEEPADMFGDVDQANIPDAEIPVLSQPSALDKGILKPKVSNPIQQTNYTVPPEMAGPSSQSGVGDIYSVKEPTLTRNIMTVLIILILGGILGGGGWWIYNKFVKTSGALETPTGDTTSDSVTETPTVEENLPTGELPATPEVTGENTNTTNTNDVVNDVVDSQVLFGEPMDKDADGLDDAKEVELGTDPNNWDSDLDELSDGDEVLVWKTNPLNPDTDGDKYKDGTEVKSGYNPNGPGKIFEPPKEVKK